MEYLSGHNLRSVAICPFSQELDKYNEKLSQLENRVHEAMSHGKNGEDMKKLETRLANVHGSGGGQGQLKELERQVQAATN
jgi:hypothetical protein